jgi:arsenate reductase (thioredoxin)
MNLPVDLAPASASGAAVPSVLFLCVHNAGRSQMAAGWLRTLSEGRVRVLSAGSTPAASLNQRAVEAMAEVDIDIAGAQPQRWTEKMLGEVDVVVTMGCGDTCPYVPGTRYVDWPLPDPAGQPIEMVRAVRDLIRERVLELLAELKVNPTG